MTTSASIRRGARGPGRRIRTSNLAVAALAACAVAPPAPARGDRAAAGTSSITLAVVTADGVFVRAGASDSYYPFGTLAEGDTVQVIGEKHDWARVQTVGPAFKGFFAYIRRAGADPEPLRLEAGGHRGRTLGRARVSAPNMNTGFEAGDSWKSILQLDVDTPVTVLETKRTGDMVAYKIPLPPQAEGWISTASLRPASAAEIKAWKLAVKSPAPRQTPLARAEATLAPVTAPAPAPAPEAAPAPAAATAAADPSLTEPVTTNESRSLTFRTVPGAPVTVEPPEKRAPRKSAQDALADLEAVYGRLRGEPIATAEVLPLRDLYHDLAAAHPDNAEVAYYAGARAEQLSIWADLQRQRRALEDLRGRVRTTAEQAGAMGRRLETTGVYAAVGRLTASTIYDGRRLPRLYRVQDPASGRTLAYLRPTEDFDLVTMLGEVIGIVGSSHYAQDLRVTLLTPRGIDLLGEKPPAKTGSSSAAAVTDDTDR